MGSGARGETKDETGEAREGLVAAIRGAAASAGLAIITATRVASGELTGASNSPISGVGILSIVLCASLVVLAVAPSATTRRPLVAFALFVTSIVFACATISNDNLQDLKTGQLVGASPRKQQIALIVGVAAGAAVIPFVLNLLANAYGYAGAIGALLSHWYDRRVRSMAIPERAERLGTLVASGLIVGESIWGVINAGLIVGFSTEAPMGIVPESFALAPRLGLLGFVGAIAWLYGWMLRRSRAVL